jgi:hypothetical protein
MKNISVITDSNKNLILFYIKHWNGSIKLSNFEPIM